VATEKINVKQSLVQKPKFTTLMFFLGALVTLGYFLLGVYSFTDDAFVVQVSTPVAPRVTGVVTEVHVRNGQRVKVGDILVSLDPTHYEQQLSAAKADHEQALIALAVTAKDIEVSQHSLQGALATLDTLKTTFKAKDHPGVRPGVSQIDLSDLRNKITAQENTVESQRVSIEINKLQVKKQEQQVKGLLAAMQVAETALKHTEVLALTDGIVENVFLGIGTHVSSGNGMFTLVNDGETYVQANYDETDLVGVKAGDKATVYPRIYLGRKSFEGVVVANPFGVSRQLSIPMSGAPYVATENKWLLLPQRLPVIIKITETDEDYPLINGMSTYVRLHD